MQNQVIFQQFQSQNKNYFNKSDKNYSNKKHDTFSSIHIKYKNIFALKLS